METFLLFGPPLCVAAGFVLIQRSLCQARKINWYFLIGGISLVGASCLVLGHLSAFGGLGGAVALVIGFYALIGALPLVLWMLLSLPRWRKVVAPVLFTLLPIILFLSIHIGNDSVPERTKEQNTQIIASALERYRIDNTVYPENLDALVPKYLDILPASPEINYGWLYKNDGNDYALGYACWIDRFYVDFCVYTKETKEVKMTRILPPETPIFQVGPTPYR